MACCLTVPSHYVNQCWLLISEVLWHSRESNFTLISRATTLYNELEDYNSTHLPIMPHICVSESGHHCFIYWIGAIRHQAIFWTNAGLLLVRPLGTIFSEILIKIRNFSFTKMHLKISSAKWRSPFVRGGDELKITATSTRGQWVKKASIFFIFVPETPWLCHLVTAWRVSSLGSWCSLSWVSWLSNKAWVSMMWWTAVSILSISSWASYQIRKIAGCACTGNAGNVFTCQCGLVIPTCITARAWRTCRDACRDR